MQHRQLDERMQSGHKSQATCDEGAGTHSYQVRNGKNDDKNSVVLTHSSQGSKTYKDNDIQTIMERDSLDPSSEPLSNNDDDRELTSPNSNSDYFGRLRGYGIRPGEHSTMMPIESSS